MIPIAEMSAEELVMAYKLLEENTAKTAQQIELHRQIENELLSRLRERDAAHMWAEKMLESGASNWCADSAADLVMCLDAARAGKVDG